MRRMVCHWRWRSRAARQGGGARGRLDSRFTRRVACDCGADGVLHAETAQRGRRRAQRAAAGGRWGSAARGAHCRGPGRRPCGADDRCGAAPMPSSSHLLMTSPLFSRNSTMTLQLVPISFRNLSFKQECPRHAFAGSDGSQAAQPKGASRRPPPPQLLTFNRKLCRICSARETCWFVRTLQATLRPQTPRAAAALGRSRCRWSSFGRGSSCMPSQAAATSTPVPPLPSLPTPRRLSPSTAHFLP